MFPDYRVPQVLLHYGTMEYSDSLMKKLISGQYYTYELPRVFLILQTILEFIDGELSHGTDEEIEIRGCSIEAVERVVEKTRELIRKDPALGIRESDCNSILVDHFLWDYRRKYAKELESIPYHKTRTIFY